MIAITTTGGSLRIAAEVKIPSAEKGQWSGARIAKLVEMIQQTIEAAEMVDAAAIELKDRKKSEAA